MRPPSARRPVVYIQRHTDRPLSTLALVPQGRSVSVLTEDRSKMIEASAHGQVVITIEVEPIVKTLRAEVTVISAPRMIDVRVRGRAYKVMCTPCAGGRLTLPWPAREHHRTSHDPGARPPRVDA